MLYIRYNETPIGLINRRSYGNTYLHRAYVRDTIEGKEEAGYVAVVHGDNGKRWPVLLQWRGLDQMIFPDGYRLEVAAEDVPYDEREASRKLLLLQAEME